MQATMHKGELNASVRYYSINLHNVTRPQRRENPVNFRPFSASSTLFLNDSVFRAQSKIRSGDIISISQPDRRVESRRWTHVMHAQNTHVLQIRILPTQKNSHLMFPEMVT